MAFNTYFSAEYILSYGAIFNIIFSDRSDGKTFNFKTRALQDYNLSKYISVYVRRFKSEITAELRNNFFGDVLGDDLPEKKKYRDQYGKWLFKGCHQGVKVSTDGGQTWDWIVFFATISTASKKKSTMDPYVQRIMTATIDEYIPLDDRYCPNEMKQIMELYQSLDRKRKKLRMIVCGNRITPFNPLFDFFNLSLSMTGEKIRLYRNGSLAVQIYGNKEHRKSQEHSAFADLVEGTEYDEYFHGGVLNTLQLKSANHAGCKYVCSFLSSIGEGSVWTNGQDFIISTVRRKDGYIVVDKMYSTGRQEYDITFGSFGKVFKKAYKTGGLYFESDKAYHMFEPLLQRVWK